MRSRSTQTEAQSAAYAPDNGGKPVGKGELAFNVRDYGAKGDSATDETAAVQAAMNAIKVAGGGVLWFPNGEYVIHGNVILCDNVSITGAKGAVIRKTTGSINYAVFVGLAGANLGYGGGVKNVSLTGLTFRGNLGAGVSISAMTLHRASDVYVSNCRFLETSQNGHVFDPLGCDNIFIERSEFRGVKLVTNRSYVEAIQLDSSVKYGFGAHDSLKAGEVFDGTATRNVTVRACTFGSITVGGIKYLAQPPLGSHSWVEGNYYTNIVFEDNDVSEVQETTADSYPGILHFVAAKQVYIRNNRIDGSGISNHFVRTISHATGTLLADINLDAPELKPIPAYTPTSDLYVEGNEVRNCTGVQVIYMYGISGKSLTNVNIKNNTLINCQVGMGSNYIAHFAFVDGPVIAGNQSRGCGGGFVFLNNCNTSSVSNNTSDKNGWYAVTTGGTNQGIEIVNNTFKAQAQQIVLSGCTNPVVLGNRVELTVGKSAIVISGTPAIPGVVSVQGNTVSCTTTSTEGGIGIAAGYTKGIVLGNIALGYPSASSQAATVNAANNIFV
ncbi:glycosyl hydrolase family 28-related protein [Specibacter sp. NPDC078692]|uniref:glycosyl hydrolase family 28-related protein n=1 Tax=Specibacter sp. NPDC078692 TaxID=3155818 RepID=UPI00342E7AAF